MKLVQFLLQYDIKIFFFFLIYSIAVEEILHSGYKATKTQLNISLDQIQQPICELTKIQEKFVSLGANGTFVATEVECLKDILIMYRQCERFLMDLLTSTSEEKNNIDRLLKSFRNQLDCIHDILKCRIAVPMSNIFVSIIRDYILYILPLLSEL